MPPLDAMFVVGISMCFQLRLSAQLQAGGHVRSSF
jgi:hypothetical protein